MIEHGLYIIKKEFFELVQSLGGECDSEKGHKRPVYCCLKDSRIEGLYWAIPTSDIDHRTSDQVNYINYCLSRPSDDLRSAYYEIGMTTKKAVYKISSCFPITEKYIDHPFISNNVHVIIKRAETVSAIESKLKRILAFESRKTNYFPQRITDTKKYLIDNVLKTEDL